MQCSNFVVVDFSKRQRSTFFFDKDRDLHDMLDTYCDIILYCRDNMNVR